MTYQLEYEVLIKNPAGSGVENVVIMASDFNHAVSEAVDEFGWHNLLAIVQAPYSLADELMVDAEYPKGEA